MNKKGFSLIEIIIAISLIIVIGSASIFGIKTINKNVTINRLNQITDKILAAVEVYIETNKETYNQIYNKKNGAIIPLNVLVNEGLLDVSNTNLSDNAIQNNYVVSMLSTNPNTDDCINIVNITSWSESSNEPIYICPGNDSGGTSDVKEKLTNNEYYIAKGVNPNNWVKFEVTSDSSKAAYFPNDAEKDLWRIVSIDSTGQIKLIYNKNIITNNLAMYNDSNTQEGGYFQLKDDYNIYTASGDAYVKFYTNNSDATFANSIWSRKDLASNSDKGKKHDLLNKINANNFINESNYYFYYEVNGGLNYIYGMNESSRFTSKIGMINIYEYYDSFINGNTYLLPESTNDEYIIGYRTSARTSGHKSVITTNGWSFYNDNEYNENNYYDINYYSTTSKCGFRPVIVLKEQVELKEDMFCSSTNKPGSKECPYIVKCSEC